MLHGFSGEQEWSRREGNELMLGKEREESQGSGLCINERKRIKCTEEGLALDKGVYCSNRRKAEYV